MNNELHHTDLVEDIGEQISKGWNTVNKLQNLSHYLDSERDYYHDEYDLEKLSFEFQLEKLYLSLCLVIESLQLPSLLSNFKSDFAKYEGKITNLGILPYIGDFHSEVLDLFRKYHSSLSVLLGNKGINQFEIEKRKQFESILINTPKIIKDREIEPKNESEVRKCVYDILIHIFPDTVREIPIVQETKTYKPDIGIRSLKVAAEYKFADSEEEVKKAVGGLYEDMRGYNGSNDWKYFYAVVYMTDAFFTKEQIMSEFKHTNSDDNWTPILVIGKGARKKRTI